MHLQCKWCLCPSNTLVEGDVMFCPACCAAPQGPLVRGTQGRLCIVHNGMRWVGTKKRYFWISHCTTESWPATKKESMLHQVKLSDGTTYYHVSKITFSFIALDYSHITSAMLDINHDHASHTKSFITAFRCSTFEIDMRSKKLWGVASALKIPTEGHEVTQIWVFYVGFF